MIRVPVSVPSTEDLYSVPGVSDGDTLITRGRIRDANAALNCVLSMIRDDQQASYNRTRVQAMFDGMPPLSDYELRLMGQGNVANANWGQGIEILEEAKAPYPSLIQNTETLCTLPIRSDYGDINLRNAWQPIIEKEFTTIVRKWKSFYPRFCQLVHQTKAHGVGVTYWEDDIDWRFYVDGLQKFKFPRECMPDADEIEVVGCRTEILPHVLYQKINKPDAEALGWNVENCRRALLYSQPGQPFYTDWEQWEMQYKDNDYLLSFQGKQPTVNGVYVWAAELDGTVSQYLVSYDNPNLGFLYKKEGRFSSMGQQFVLFTDGVGSNGTLHSIRGLGQVIFSKVLADNRIWNRMTDLAIFTSTPIFEPPDDDSLQTDALIPVGAFNVLGPGWKFPESNRMMPNYENSLMPIVSGIRERLVTSSARYTRSVPSLQGRQPLTKYAEQMRQETLAGLSEAQINLFMAPWETVLQNIVRRFTRKGYLNIEPGGKFVWELKKRLLARGVDPEVIHSIDVDAVQAVLPLGAGSPQQLANTLERLMPISGSFDQTGQAMFKRDYVVAVAGVSAADRYTPADTIQRTPVDEPLATVQNGQLRQGFPQPVFESDNDVVHAQTHLGGENGINSILMQMPPEGQMPVTESIPQLEPLYIHGMQHLERAAVSDPNNPMVKDLNQQYEQVAGILHNGALQLQKLEEQAARDAEGGLGSQNGQMTGQQNPEAEAQSMKIMTAVMEAQAKLRMAQENHAQQLAQRQEKFEQEQSLRDAQAAADLLRRHASQ